MRDGLVAAVTLLVLDRDYEAVAGLFGELQLVPTDVIENPYQFAALTTASFQSGRTREALEYFAPLAAAWPEFAGLNETLEVHGPVTLFAPNNQAFGRLTEDLVKNMRADNQLLLTVLENHIVMGKRIILGDLEDEELMLTTIGGRSLRINVYKKSKFYRVSKVVCHLQQKRAPPIS